MTTYIFPFHTKEDSTPQAITIHADTLCDAYADFARYIAYKILDHVDFINFIYDEDRIERFDCALNYKERNKLMFEYLGITVGKPSSIKINITTHYNDIED